jgi:hypothetical protein
MSARINNLQKHDADLQFRMIGTLNNRFSICVTGMPRRGVEPPSPCEHWHLKPACLPFHHLGVGQPDEDAERPEMLPNYTACGTICQV